jgi:glycosyltransferase involved in cell wall biosynthesis
MPVHNAMPYLDEAVESILVQTFADFEFVILDDASTDGSSERLR